MQGIVFTELQKYVETNLGSSAWEALCTRSGVGRAEFDPLQTYPDGEALALVQTASQLTGKPIPDILESFGEFIAPDLLQMFWGAVEPSWKTLDLLQHAEAVVHTLVRAQNPGATPPILRATRESATHLLMVYDSQRKMCALARGLARGVARHYGETLRVEEPQCMHRGASECHLRFHIA
jgi:hypothetical protein